MLRATVSCFVMMGIVGLNSAIARDNRESPMVGWSCRMLNLTEAQSMDFNIHIPVRADPSPTSPVVGNASETVAIDSTIPARNGFLRAMFPTGRLVWIAANDVKPWHAAANPSARCIPVTKANGKPGFEYP
jgi:hypothetical protein